MSATEAALKASETYAREFQLGHLPMPPARKLAIVACMDARITVEDILGLGTGDAHIIRNAGGIVTEDALRSLIISQQLLGTGEVIIINHTDCGMLTFSDEALRTKLETETGVSAVTPARFHSFADLEKNVRQQIQRVRSHAWIPKSISVRGFIYDVKSGALREVRTSEAGRGATGG